MQLLIDGAGHLEGEHEKHRLLIIYVAIVDQWHAYASVLVGISSNGP